MNAKDNYYAEVESALAKAPHRLARAINGAPHDYPSRKALKGSKVRAAAERIRQVADFFEAHPDLRIKGEEINILETKVCAIGAVNYANKIGLVWEPKASKNCNASVTTDLMFSAGLVHLNDSPMPAAQFRTWMRHTADVLDRLSRLKHPITKQDVIEAYMADPYFRKWATAVGSNIFDVVTTAV